LGGHAFLPSFAIPSPFADSQASVALGFGYRSYTTSVLGGDRELKLAGFQPSVQGQVHLFSGLALNFGFSGSLVTGVNSAAVLDYGASTAYALQLGALYEVLRTDTDVFSLALEVQRPHTLALSPLDAANAGLQQLLGAGDPNYAASQVTTRWAPDLRYAHTFAKFIGFRSFLGLRLDNTTSDGEASVAKSLINLGLGLSTDFKEVIGVPVGLTANYRRGQVLSSGASNSDALTFGIFETGNDAFNIGAELGFVRTGAVNTTIGAILARGYFN
jgi:hypothetical protein